MSFTRFLQDDPLHTRSWYMQLFIDVAKELGLPEKAACVLAAMCTFQEVGVLDNDPPRERRVWLPANPGKEPSSKDFDHDSESNDGRSVGICQQQRGPNGELWWGTVADEMNPRTAIRNFMLRLPKGFHANDAGAANGFVQAVQRSGVPNAYAQWWGDAIRLYNEVKAGTPATVPPPPVELPDPDLAHGPWSGDPIWLADVLRREGVAVFETPGWRDRGHGDMGALWGVICHHTGSSGSTWESIAYGRPDLKGPLSQIHLRRDGTAEIVAAGVCWHAGTGGAPGLGLHTGNQRTIGIEAQNNGSEGWSPAQYTAYVRICAAFCRRIGVDASHVRSHKEYDLYDPATAEGKWDPGLLGGNPQNMDAFRRDVQKQIDTRSTNPQEDGMANLDTVVASESPFRFLDEKPHMTLAQFITSIDGMTHMRHAILCAAIGDSFHRKLIESIANADPAKYPDRVANIELAKLAIAALDDGTLSGAIALGDAVAKAAETVAPTAELAPPRVVAGGGEIPAAVKAPVGCPISTDGTCVAGKSATSCSLSTDGRCVAKVT